MQLGEQKKTNTISILNIFYISIKTKVAKYLSCLY